METHNSAVGALSTVGTVNMIDAVRTSRPTAGALRELIRQRWPESVTPHMATGAVFSTGLPALDTLFPLGGIPCGQLIEITGPISSGKTSLLFRLLAHLTLAGQAAYVDCNGSFFPAAAAATAIDLTRLLLVTPEQSSHDPVKLGIRSAEMLLDRKAVRWLVCDLVGQTRSLSITLLHRLRLKTVRAGALTIFLTEDNSEIIPSSMASLRLAVDRLHGTDRRVQVNVVKSRISREGLHTELAL